MHIQEIQLKNFRNYDQLSMPLADGIHVIIGENAQGKTNFLEAIYVLAMAKSHRTANDKELIQWEKDYAKIEGRVYKQHSRLPLEIIISKKGKIAKCNHLEQRRLSQYVGNMNVVLFAPEDLNIVKGSPLVRRRFLDMEIGQISPVYLYEISQYQKILRQRNQYLKMLQGKRQADGHLLEIYTEQLIQLAAKVVRRRFEFLQSLEKWATDIHSSITSGKERLTIRYCSSADVSEEDDLTTMINKYQEKFEKGKNKEIERGSTLYGPHRDDLIFCVNDREVQTYGSQGQQRTAALSLKLAEIDLIRSEIGEYPVLLLDDVLSELDDFRKSLLLTTISGKVQTFITATGIDGIDHQALKDAYFFIVSNGKIAKE